MSFQSIIQAGVIAVWFLSTSHDTQRAAPPSPVTCDRNHLTSFTGRVVSYNREKGRIALAMRTDEETNEKFSVRLEQGEDGSKHFLMRGQQFTETDWAIIEVSRSKLRQGMRAIVWVCDDGSAPVIDWRPREP